MCRIEGHEGLAKLCMCVTRVRYVRAGHRHDTLIESNVLNCGNIVNFLLLKYIWRQIKLSDEKWLLGPIVQDLGDTVCVGQMTSREPQSP